MKRVSGFVTVLFSMALGCASNSGVMSVGPDTFMVSRQAATGFSGLGTLKADAMAEARAYCSGRGKVLQVVSTSESAPPYVWGNFPRAEVQFMCLASDDPELSRPKLRPQANVVVESTVVVPAQANMPSSVAPLVPVSIESDPAGADVVVDGAFVGSTPLPSYGLSPGKHSVQISRRGYIVWSREVLIQPGVPTRLRATLEREPVE